MPGHPSCGICLAPDRLECGKLCNAFQDLCGTRERMRTLEVSRQGPGTRQRAKGKRVRARRSGPCAPNLVIVGQKSEDLGVLEC